jgi:protein KRI1
VEILMATDAELNEYMSVKKYAPYRTNRDVKWDGKRNDRLKELKTRIAERSGGALTDDAGGRQMKKRKGKKERQKQKTGVALLEAQSPADLGQVPEVADAETWTKRGRVSPTEVEAEGQVEGQPAKKKRRRHKKTETRVES